jgi:branched-chain amino acid transport system permease protein
MKYFFELLVNGLMLGGLYGVVALGLVLIYKATKVFNFAQGELVMIGAYFFYTLVSICGLPIWLGFIGMFLICSLLAYLLERSVLRPLVGQPMLAIIMMTICLSATLKGFVILLWGGRRQILPEFIPKESLVIAEIHISQHLLWCFIAAVLATLIFAFFFRYTYAGLIMRATADGHNAARSVGVKVPRVFVQTWVISSVLAGIGGVFIGTLQGVDPELGHIGIVALPVALLGGLDSISGAILGGLIVGITETLGAGYLDAMVGGGLREITPFVVMAIIVLIRPYGLFGLEKIERI